MHYHDVIDHMMGIVVFLEGVASRLRRGPSARRGAQIRALAPRRGPGESARTCAPRHAEGHKFEHFLHGATPEKKLEFLPLGMPRATNSSTFSWAVKWSKCLKLCPRHAEGHKFDHRLPWRGPGESARSCAPRHAEGHNFEHLLRGRAMEQVLEFVPFGMPRATNSSTFSVARPWRKCANLCPLHIKI